MIDKAVSGILDEVREFEYEIQDELNVLAKLTKPVNALKILPK